MPQTDGFRHEAFFYADQGDFLTHAAAFIREAVAAGEPVLMVTDAVKIVALRAVLDGETDGARFVDVAKLGRNPARILPVWLSFVDQNSADGQRLRGICAPVLSDRSHDELVECHYHEALLNDAFADTAGFWLLCAYDTAAIDPVVIDHAHDTHSVIEYAGESHPSDRYLGAEAAALLQEPLPEPPVGVEVHEFGVADLASVRRIASRHGRAAGLGDQATDVALVADELATNSVRHGDGGGALRLWRQGAALVVEVRDGGHMVDPLVGRRRPVDGRVGGRGLWVVNQICDLVQVRSSPAGTTVRAHISSNDRDK